MENNIQFSESILFLNKYILPDLFHYTIVPGLKESWEAVSRGDLNTLI